MGRINTPVNQKRLTNVAVMRLKKAGIRFEIACYPNKVQEWQKKIEKDLSEVLQVVTVFSSVSKGVVANDKELMLAFKSTNHEEICMEILKSGELQVSEKERKGQLENLYRDVATIVAEKCVNSENGKPLTVGVIERALQEIHFNINPNKTAKSQALAAIKLLKESGTVPIERAKMRILVTLNSATAVEDLKKSEAASDWNLEKEGSDSNSRFLQIAIDPSHFRLVTDLSKADGGSVEVLSQHSNESQETASSSNAGDT